MAKKKVYAVRCGKTKGIFLTWDACKAVVEGYPGAEYKGFYSKEEAEAYLTGAGKPDKSPAHIAGRTEQATAYVDGSYSEQLGRYAFGCVILTPDGEIIKESGNGENPESLALRNVAGEMLGAMSAVLWCVKNDYPAVNICYDYSGIECWVTGAWKAKNPLTKKYADYMRKNANRVKISFTKIAAHTGNRYNEEADQLAKMALMEEKGAPDINFNKEKELRYKLVIFDLDGTVLNTLEDLKDSLNVCLEQENYPKRTLEEVRNFVGNGIHRLIERALPDDAKDEVIERVYKKYISYYQSHCAIKTKPYDKIPELLFDLRAAGCKTAVVSNKADAAVRALCNQFFSGQFDYFVGERAGILRKPAPDSVYETLRQLEIPAEHAVYIGDSDVDIQTAQNANIDCISVDWGFRSADFLKAHGASVIVSDPNEIMNLCMEAKQKCYH